MTRARYALVAVLVASTFAGCGHSAPRVTKLAIDGRPSAIAAAEGHVWVTDDLHHSVHEIDAVTYREIGRPIRVEKNPIAIAADASGVWIAHASGSVVRIDPGTRKADHPIHVGGSLTGITLLHGRVWVTDLEGNAIVEIDPAKKKVVYRKKLPEGAVRILAAGGSLWITGRDTMLYRFSPVSRKVSGSSIGSGPIGMAYDGIRVWVAVSDDNTIATNTKVAVKVGRGPVAVGVAGNRVWAADQDDANLVPVDLITLKVGLPIPLGVEPRGVVTYKGVLWIAGVNRDAVVRVQP